MPLDPTTNLEEGTKISQPNKSAKELASALQEVQIFGSPQQKKFTTKQLGLDDVETYRDYIDVDLTNMIQEDVNTQRAENQSGWGQLMNAVGSGILKGGVGTIEQISYMADFNSFINSAGGFKGLDEWERNVVAKQMQKYKEDLDKVMPIYRVNPNEVFDLDDPGFYHSSLSSLMQNVIEFGLSGGAASKATRAGMKMLSAGKIGNWMLRTIPALQKSKQATKLLKNTGAVEDGMSLLGASFIQNNAENMTMGYEEFDDVYNELKRLQETGQINMTDKQMRQYAGNAMNEVLLNGKAFLLTNMLGLHGLTKGSKMFRVTPNATNFKGRFAEFSKGFTKLNTDNFFVQGLGEALEEVGQSSVQSEAGYQARKAAGIEDPNLPQNKMERMLEFATSEEALLEGIMGFLGGGPQRVMSEISSGRWTKTARQRNKDLIESQKQALRKSEQFVTEFSKNITEKLKNRDKALVEGDDDSASLWNDSISHSLIKQHINAKSLDQLERQVTEILSNENASTELGQLEKNALNNMLNDIKELENVAVIYSNIATGKALVNNKSKQIITERAVEKNKKKIVDTINNLKRPLKNKEYISNLESITDKESYDNFLKYNPYDKKTQSSKHTNYEKFKERITNKKPFQELVEEKGYIDAVNKLDTELYKLIEEEVYLKSKEGIAQVEKLQKEIEDIERASDKVRSENTRVKENKIKPNSFYETKGGDIYKYVGTDEEGNIITERPQSEGNKSRQYIFTPENFQELFMGEEGYTGFTDKATLEQIKDDVHNNASNNVAKQRETKTKEDQEVSNTPNNFTDDVKKPEPYNPTEGETKFEYHGDKIMGKATALGWISATNPWTQDPNRDYEITDDDNNITEFLEDKDNNLIGHIVRYTIDESYKGKTEKEIAGIKDAVSKYKKSLKAKGSDAVKQVDDMIDYLPIKVELINNDGEVVTHKGTPISIFTLSPNSKWFSKKADSEEAEEKRGQIKEALINNRNQIITSLIVNKNKDTYTRINYVGNGNINNESYNEKGEKVKGEYNILTTMKEDKAENITLALSVQNGSFYYGKDAKGNNFNNKQTKLLDTIPRRTGRKQGRSFFYDTTKNGSPFPVAAMTAKVTEEEANIIYELYEVLINPETEKNLRKVAEGFFDPTLSQIDKYYNSKGRTPIGDMIRSSSEERTSNILQVLSSNPTMTEILNALVYQGNNSMDKSYPLRHHNRKIEYGADKNGNPNYLALGAANYETYKQKFITWLTENKIRNVDSHRINDPKYKQYILETGVLYSDAIPSTTNKGVNFSNPTISLSRNISTDINNVPLVNKEEAVKENVTPSGGTFEKAIDNLNKTIEAGERFKLDSTDTFYSDGILKIMRQSNYIKQGLIDTGLYREPGTKGEENMERGAAVGNLIDIIARDILRDIQKSRAEYITEANTKNKKKGYVLSNQTFSEKTFNTLVNDLKEFRDTLLDKGYVFETREMFVYKEFNEEAKKKYGFDGVGGTMDAVAIDPEGRYHIIDFKNKKLTNTEKAREYVFPMGQKSDIPPAMEGWQRQQTVYKTLLEDNTGIPVVSPHILLYHTKYTVDNKKISLNEIIPGAVYASPPNNTKNKNFDSYRKGLAKESGKIISVPPASAVSNKVLRETGEEVVPASTIPSGTIMDLNKMSKEELEKLGIDYNSTSSAAEEAEGIGNKVLIKDPSEISDEDLPALHTPTIIEINEDKEEIKEKTEAIDNAKPSNNTIEYVDGSDEIVLHRGTIRRIKNWSNEQKDLHLKDIAQENLEMVEDLLSTRTIAEDVRLTLSMLKNPEGTYQEQLDALEEYKERTLEKIEACKTGK